MISFKGAHFPKDIILYAVFFYVRYGVSYRDGKPGFVRALNETYLAYPEYRGNGVLASQGNITENPHIGMIFVDFLSAVSVCM